MDYRTDIGYLLKFKDQYLELQQEVERLLISLPRAAPRRTDTQLPANAAGNEGKHPGSRAEPLPPELLESFRHIACHLPVLGWRAGRGTLRALFDADWYFSQSKVRLFRLRHYLQVGERTGFQPHPLFDPRHYLSANRLDGLGMNAFRHFCLVGGLAGLSPHPLFDARWYLARYPDVATARVNPLLHYCRFGHAEGRDPSPRFSTQFYLRTHGDVRESKLNPLVHYALYGQKEGRKPLG